MRVINHNWSAMKQHLHVQSVAEVSRHSVLSATNNTNSMPGSFRLDMNLVGCWALLQGLKLV